MKYLTEKYYRLIRQELIRERDKKLRALRQIFGISLSAITEKNGK